MPRPPKINWSLVDWSKTDTEISNSTGVCPSRVGRARKTLAPRTFSDGRRGRPALLTGVDWSNVDLSRPTAELARELGVSQTGVRRQKQKIARNATKLSNTMNDKPASESTEVVARKGIGSSALVGFFALADRFEGIDLQCRRGWISMLNPGAKWRARLVANKNERGKYRIEEWGESAEEAAEKVLHRVATIDFCST